VRIRRHKRGQRAAKRLDLTDLRKALQDRRVWCGHGIVVAGEDGQSHYELVTGAGGDVVDILVEVELQPMRTAVLARLGGGAGSSGAGIWAIPDIGTEVIVSIPDGRLEYQPTIVGTLAAAIPNPSGQGPAPGRLVIAAPKVFIHDGGGGARPLAFKDDVDALADYVRAQFDPATGHVHKAIVPAAPTAIVEGTPGGGQAPATTVPDAEGTDTLETT
jgi:hypothetical protein